MTRHTQRISVLFLLLLYAGAEAAYGQLAQDFLQSAFQSYRTRHYEEKIFLHTSQSALISGETLWCRIYLTNAHTHQPSTLSKVAYLDMMDGRGKSVWQSTVRIDSGMGLSTWQVPQNLATGKYVLRAYTRWMRNQDPAFFFQKEIMILNPTRKPVIPISPVDSIHLQVFPEGGRLIAGIENRITYLVQDRAGKGIDIELCLVREKKDTIARTKPVGFGMGDFILVPEEGVRYSLSVRDPSLGKQETDLPGVQLSGYAIRADAVADTTLELQVLSRPGTNEHGCYLFIHCRNTNPRAFYEPFRNGKAIFQLPLASLGDGISHLTVFDERKKPVSERLWFTNPRRRAVFDIQPDSSSYAARSPVKVSVQSRNESGKPIDTRFSTTVMRIHDSADVDESDILSYLYLSSDLTGRIENPHYYFSTDSGCLAIQADLLMRTHGWRRFRWDDMLEGRATNPMHPPEYSGPMIEAIVAGKTGRVPLSGRTVALTVPGIRYHLDMGVSGKDGKLALPLEQREGAGELAFQVMGPGADTTLVIPLTSFDSAEMKPVIPLRGNSENSWKSLEIELVETQLSQAFGYSPWGAIRAFEQTDSTAFFGLPDRAYPLDDYVRFTTMEEIFREYVREVDVRKNRNQYRLLVTNLPMKALFQEDPLILLDGIPQRDVNRVMQYDPLKIKKIELVARRYHLGGLSFPGIISLQTYEGNLEGFELPPGLLVTDYEGLQVWREFASPSHPSAMNSRMPDLRRLLYWHPDGKTGNGKNENLRFHVSDLPGKYAIIVQGLDRDGRAGSSVHFITVR